MGGDKAYSVAIALSRAWLRVYLLHDGHRVRRQEDQEASWQPLRAKPLFPEGLELYRNTTNGLVVDYHVRVPHKPGAKS